MPVMLSQMKFRGSLPDIFRCANVKTALQYHLCPCLCLSLQTKSSKPTPQSVFISEVEKVTAESFNLTTVPIRV